MFWGEFILCLLVLSWASIAIINNGIGGVVQEYQNSCTAYVWVLFVLLSLFEVLSSKRHPRKFKESLGIFWNERKGTENGIAIGSCLIPLSLLVHTVIVPPSSEDPLSLLPYFDASISTPLVILTFYVLGFIPGMKWLGTVGKYILALSVVSYGFALWTNDHGVNVEWHFVSGTIAGCVFYLLSFSFQQSFTIGEQMCIAQGLSLTALNAISITFNVYLGNSVSFTYQHIVTQGVTQGMFICCLVTFPLLQYIRKKQLQILKKMNIDKMNEKEKQHKMGTQFLTSISCILFYIISFISITSIDIAIQNIAGIEPFSWTLKYTFTDIFLSFVCVYWVVLIIFTIILLSPENRPNVPNIIIRKFYHIVTIFMFVPVIYVNIEFIYIAFGAAFGGMIFAEGLRFGLIPPFGYKIELFMRSFTDSRDTGIVILSHIYLLLGCASTVWISRIHYFTPSNELPALIQIAPYAGVLILGVGDTMASIIGINYGKKRWPGSKKTFMGTFGAFISLNIIVILLILAHGISLEYYQWINISLSCLFSCLLEALTEQNDNLILPIYFDICIILSSYSLWY